MRTHALLFPSLLLLACTGAPEPARDASATLARHLAWSGGEAAWRSLRGIAFVGDVETMGLRGDLDLRLHRDGFVHQRFDLGTLSGAEGIDARGGWRRNQSGQMEALPAPDLARWQRDVALAFQRPLWAGNAGRSTWVRRDALDGVAVDVISLGPDAAGELFLWIAEDGAMLAQERAFDGGVRRTTFGDWRVVDGVRMPFVQVVTGTNPQTVRWREIRSLPELVAAAMARPATTPANTGSGVPTTVPLDLYEGRYLFARGQLQGQDTDLVVDSGAGITVVDAELARVAGLQGQGMVTARGAGGEGRPVQLCQNVRLRLGTLELPPLTVAILDLGEVHRRLGRRMPVILGKELFHAYPVTVDYERRELVVHDPAAFTPPAGAVELPIRPLDDGHVMVQLQLEDLEPAWCMVDTGSGDTVMFHTPYVQQHALTQRWSRLGERTYGGVGGSLVGKVAVAKSVTLAGVEFPQVPVSLAVESRGAMASATSSGTLGAELLSRFQVTFDYARDRLLLVPGKDAATRPFRRDRIGLTPGEQDGAFVVEHVGAGSPAQAAGLKVGDVLAEIDGKPVDATVVRSALRAASAAPAGTAVRVRLGSGEERVITTADWY